LKEAEDTKKKKQKRKMRFGGRSFVSTPMPHGTKARPKKKRAKIHKGEKKTQKRTRKTATEGGVDVTQKRERLGGRWGGGGGGQNKSGAKSKKNDFWKGEPPNEF